MNHRRLSKSIEDILNDLPEGITKDDIVFDKIENTEEESTTAESTETIKDNTIEETETESEEQYLTLADGTDISSIDILSYRKALSKIYKEQILLWHNSLKLLWYYQDRQEYGTGCTILSGDYIFPNGYNNSFFGFILQITEKMYNGSKYWYIDMAIGKDIKTIRSSISSLNDVIKTAIIKKYGRCFEINDLIYQPISVKIENETDEFGNPTYTNIMEFKFLNSAAVDCLNTAYEIIKNLD